MRLLSDRRHAVVCVVLRARLVQARHRAAHTTPSGRDFCFRFFTRV